MSTEPPVTVADEFAAVTVSLPTQSRPTILLAAVGTGVRASVELTASGAYQLARELRTASVRTTADQSSLLGDPSDIDTRE